MHKAIRELEGIIENMNGFQRKEKFDQWKQKWLNKSEAAQYVINRSTMSSENHDFTCEYVAKLCIDEMIESQCVDFNIEKNCYTATIWSLKNEKPKKSKKNSKVSR